MIERRTGIFECRRYVDEICIRDSSISVIGMAAQSAFEELSKKVSKAIFDGREYVVKYDSPSREDFPDTLGVQIAITCLVTLRRWNYAEVGELVHIDSITPEMLKDCTIFTHRKFEEGGKIKSVLWVNNGKIFNQYRDGWERMK